MHTDPILDEIVSYFKAIHQVHTIILYGSRARNEASDISDYDIVAIHEKDNFVRDCQIFKGFYLDAFIYPEEEIKNLDNYMIRIKDGIVLCQKDIFGDTLLKQVKELYQAGPPKIPAWEKQEIIIWIKKMLDRAKMKDIEGHFRLHWLLHDLLECYFKLRNMWYLGPKEIFQWLKRHDLTTYHSFEEALKPTININILKCLVEQVISNY